MFEKSFQQPARLNLQKAFFKHALAHSLTLLGAIFYKTKRAEDLSSSALMQLTGLEPVPSQPGLDP